MKNLKKLMVVFIAAITTVSCGDPELPVELFPEMQYGAYARKMTQTGEFNYFDISNSSITMDVEYYDEANGANITSFDIDVEYVDNISGGAKSVARTDLKTINSSEFTTNADGYLSSVITLGFTEALGALGITSADVDGGAYFRYWFTITKVDGTVYDYNNTGPNLMSSNAFSALFRQNISIICPSDLAGSLLVSQTTIANAGVGWPAITLTDVPLTLEAASAPGVYIVAEDNGSWGSWPEVYGSTSNGPSVADACNILSMSGADQYGDTYSLTAGTVSVSTDSKTLSFQWVNTWGEAGDVTAKYADGSSWPDLTN